MPIVDGAANVATGGLGGNTNGFGGGLDGGQPLVSSHPITSMLTELDWGFSPLKA